MSIAKFKRLWQGFWQLADPKIWIASTIPMLFGASLAYNTRHKFDFPWFIVSLIAIYLIEIGKNSSNEYVDFITGVDINVSPLNKTPFSGGKKTIVEGKLTLKEVFIIALITFLLAMGLGLIIVLFKETQVLWVGILGIFIAIFYSLPPFKFSYTGLGEFAVGFTFGPLITLGVYILMAGTFDYKVLVAGLPIGFLIANVLWINQYPDYEADKAGNKKNWLVRMGKKEGLKIYGLLYILAYFSFAAIALAYKNPLWLIGLATFPLAIKSVKIASKEFDNIPKLIPANIYTLVIYQVTGLTMVLTSFFIK